MRFAASFVACALAFLLAGCAGFGGPVYPGEEWAAADPEGAGLDDQKLETLRVAAEVGNTQSMVVVKGGRIVFSYGDIVRTEGTYMASVRKSFLSMLMGEWVEKGVIDLDATLADLNIDDIECLTGVEQSATVREIISARSGIYHPASNASGVTEADPKRGDHAPGEYYWYNNWDFNAAGGVFEQLTGENIYEAFEKQLSEPLALQDFDLAKHLADGKSGDLTRSSFPAYHFYLSARDMARIGLLMLRNGKWRGKTVVPKAWIAESTSLVTPNADMNPERIKESGFGYGYMWWVFDETQFPPAYRGGYAARGHFGQYIVVLPAMDLVIAHKTLPVDYDTPEEYEAINVTWDEMRVLVDLTLDAMNE